MANANASLLSQRGREAAEGASDNLLWKLVSDIWNVDSNPNGYVSVGIAENSLMHAELLQHITQHIDLQTVAFTYGDGPRGATRLRRAVARFLNKHLRPFAPLDESHILNTNGVSHAIEHCSWAFANKGDGILLGRPYYRSFLRDLGLRPQVEVVQVDFQDVDPMSVEAVQNYEQAILDAQIRGVRIAGLTLCSPHNPLGRCYSKDALIAYFKLCQKYQVHLISDEIYALSIWENTVDSSPARIPFTSVLAFDLKEYIDPALVHVIWGISKDFGANGLRLGFVISPYNESFIKAVNEVALFSSVSSISEHVTANVLEDEPWTDNYIRTNSQRLSQAYSYAASYLSKHGIEHVPGANAAFFLWLDLGKAYLQRHPDRASNPNIDDELMKALLQHRVFLGSGTQFGSEKPGYFRLTFSHPSQYMEVALQRIIKAIETGPTSQPVPS